MDCKFINQNDIHEKYLLDRLNETEKSEYLIHLSSCDSCKSNLDSVKETLASIRHFGKNEMKSEITRQVAEKKSRKKDVSWDMILKVAAIFFFLVITPGLVYYYQSVEPPQIGELYEFDEVINQQQETDKIEDEENIQNKRAAIKKEKNETRGATQDILGSASGAGSQNSMQPVGLSKPVKKSTPPIKESGDLSTNDNFEEEKLLTVGSKESERSARVMKSISKTEESESVSLSANASPNLEQPEPTLPKTSLPEFKKFIKPKYFRITDHESFKDKGYRSYDQSMPGSSTISNTTQNQSSVKIENDIDADNLRLDQFYHLRYNINHKKISINLIPDFDKSEFFQQETYPSSFPVIIKNWRNEDITLDSFINEKIRKIDPVQISIHFENEKFLYLYFLNEAIYKIDLQKDSTNAILVDR